MKAIEITKGKNGYPEKLHRGYIGFETIDEAKEFAKKYNGKVVSLHKKEGWQLWESQGKTNELYKRNLDKDYPDKNYYALDIEDIENEDDFVINARDYLSANIHEYTFQEIECLASDAQKVFEEILDLNENEVLIVEDNIEIVDRIELECMEYYYDTHYYSIGVELEFYNQEADDECTY